MSQRSMPVSEVVRVDKRPRQSHVTLAQDSITEDGSQRTILVGHRVREEVAEKPALLEGLAHAGGLASLPVDLSSEDVQLWQASKLVDAVPSTDELVTVLKVRCHFVLAHIHGSTRAEQHLINNATEQQVGWI